MKTFLPLVTRPCRFDQITRGKIKPRTDGFINHVLMAAILISTLWKEPGESGKGQQQQQQQHKLYLHDYNYVVTVLQKL